MLVGISVNSSLEQSHFWLEEPGGLKGKNPHPHAGLPHPLPPGLSQLHPLSSPSAPWSFPLPPPTLRALLTCTCRPSHPCSQADALLAQKAAATLFTLECSLEWLHLRVTRAKQHRSKRILPWSGITQSCIRNA